MLLGFVPKKMLRTSQHDFAFSLNVPDHLNYEAIHSMEDGKAHYMSNYHRMAVVTPFVP